MTERLLAAALIPAWWACTAGWAGWMAVHFVVAPWRFVR